MVKFNDPVIARFLKESAAPKITTIEEIYLFGSRAKGTERPDSDYDLLLVVSPKFTFEDRDRLYGAVMSILLSTGRLVSLKIFKEQEFKRLCDLGTPFMQHVMTDGIKIG